MINLKNYIKVNDNFKNAINLYLNLNKPDKILSYIPTKSSVLILNEYLESVKHNREQSTILIGPYGKGKSHLLLILLSILSMERKNNDNQKVMKSLINSIKAVDKQASDNIDLIWTKKGKFLPVIISSSHTDLNQSFLIALNDALKKEGLDSLTPDTFYSIALDNIKTWKREFKETYDKFENELIERGIKLNEFINNLKECNKDSMNIFKDIYPKLTSGSQFSPLINSEILPLFKNINDILHEEYGYSGIYIIFDEFSKFIESKSETSAGNDMKLIQDICELSQESKGAQLFITLVAHKSIKEYGNYISQDIINSFTGIEGRITEKFFITSSKNNYELIQNAIMKDEDIIKNIEYIKPYISESMAQKYYSEIPVFKSTFDFEDFKNIIVEGCYPLNPISAYVLLNVSEKIAQNERTLFTFISKDEPNSMARYISNHTKENDWIIGVDSVYDYFKSIFKKDLSNVYVHEEWLKANYAITKCDTSDQIKVLKALALINIVNRPEELPAFKDILSNSVNIASIDDTLEELILKQLIYIQKSTGKYILKTSVGADLKKEIKNRRALKGNNANIAKVLSEVSDFDYVLPKKYNQDHAITRYFKYEFMKIENFFSLKESESLFSDEEFCDGKIIALIDNGNSEFNKNMILKHMNLLLDERIIVIKASSVFKKLKQVQDYEVIQNIKMDHDFMENNKVLQAEIEVFEEDIKTDLKKFISNSYDSNGKNTVYYFIDDKVKSTNKYDINKIVSEVCQNYYNLTPIINNELINKEFITSSPIKRARKNIIDYILSKSDDETFYNKTNPESTIYRALFVNTGITSNKADVRMKAVMLILKEFLDLCKDEKLPINSVIEKLSQAPIAIRKGIIPFYIAYAMKKTEGDILVYLGDKEFDITTDILINMCESNGEYKIFISTENEEKDKYIDNLKDMFIYEGMQISESSRLKIVLISMQRWYHSLPQITRIFNLQPDYIEDTQLFKSVIGIRSLLQKADGNPYEIIFIMIPSILNTESDYESTIERLITIKKLLEDHLNQIVSNLIFTTKKEFNCNSEKNLYYTLKEWYENQSELSKKGVSSSQIPELMSYIENLDIYDDKEIVRKLITIVTGAYIENWTDFSYDDYLNSLNKIKNDIENINDKDDIEDQSEISFTDSKGNKIIRCYEKQVENTAIIMRNMIEGTIEEFEDSVSTNDRVAILVEMLEKVLN